MKSRLISLPSWPLLGTALVAALGLGACGGPTVEIIDDSFEVVHASPHHGAIDVELSATLLVGFTEALARDDLSSSVKLFAETDDGELNPVSTRPILEDDGLVLLVVPRNALEAGRRYRLELAPELEARSGALLAAPFRTEFVTRR